MANGNVSSVAGKKPTVVYDGSLKEGKCGRSVFLPQEKEKCARDQIMGIYDCSGCPHEKKQ